MMCLECYGKGYIYKALQNKLKIPTDEEPLYPQPYSVTIILCPECHGRGRDEMT